MYTVTRGTTKNRADRKVSCSSYNEAMAIAERWAKEHEDMWVKVVNGYEDVFIHTPRVKKEK